MDRYINISTVVDRFNEDFKACDKSLLRYFMAGDSSRDVDYSVSDSLKYLIVGYVEKILSFVVYDKDSNGNNHGGHVYIDCGNSYKFSECVEIALNIIAAKNTKALNLVTFKNVLFFTDKAGIDFSNCEFRNCSFEGLEIKNCGFYETNIINCNFVGVSIFGNVLQNCRFISCNSWASFIKNNCIKNSCIEKSFLVNSRINNNVLELINYVKCCTFIGTMINDNRVVGKIEVDEHSLGAHPVCPESGSFIGYKKIKIMKGKAYGIAKLLIPENAERTNGGSRVCRCNKAKVLSIKNMENGNNCRVGNSWFDETFEYRVGKMITIDNFDKNRWNSCSNGIHFFVDEKSAREYNTF